MHGHILTRNGYNIPTETSRIVIFTRTSHVAHWNSMSYFITLSILMSRGMNKGI